MALPHFIRPKYNQKPKIAIMRRLFKECDLIPRHAPFSGISPKKGRVALVGRVFEGEKSHAR